MLPVRDSQKWFHEMKINASKKEFDNFGLKNNMLAWTGYHGISRSETNKMYSINTTSKTPTHVSIAFKLPQDLRSHCQFNFIKIIAEEKLGRVASIQ